MPQGNLGADIALLRGSLKRVSQSRRLLNEAGRTTRLTREEIDVSTEAARRATRRAVAQGLSIEEATKVGVRVFVRTALRITGNTRRLQGDPY